MSILHCYLVGKLGDLLNSNEELTCDDTEKANILNNTFTSVFTRENTKYIPTLDNVFNGAPLQDLSISQQMVENKLSKLKTPQIILAKSDKTLSI